MRRGYVEDNRCKVVIWDFSLERFASVGMQTSLSVVYVFDLVELRLIMFRKVDGFRIESSGSRTTLVVHRTFSTERLSHCRRTSVLALSLAGVILEAATRKELRVVS